ncbi:MAG TPA: alkaline phosphatase family protein [Chloroflexota bacterium]
MAYNGPVRLVVIGLDGAAPALVFDRFRSALPALTNLSAHAISGELESTIPATTLPDWPALFTGRDPGELGIYGPRQRVAHTYAAPVPVTSRAVPPIALWDVVGQFGEASIVIGAPPGYPPRPLRGVAVSCTITPPEAEVFTYPPELSARLRADGFQFDLREPGGSDASEQLQHAAALTRQRFSLLRKLLVTEPWRLAILVDPTLDRLQRAHGLEPEVVQQHYAVIDAEIGRLLAQLDPATVVAIVSSHGARASRGSFAINDWLQREGYLVLANGVPPTATPLDHAGVDWSRTLAWAEGGPAVRIMLNVQGREPAGTIEPRRYEQVRNEIKRKLEALSGPDGRTMANRAYKPEEVYRLTRRVVPDLIGTLGGMAFRAAASLGHHDLFLPAVPGVSSGNNGDRGLFMLRWPQHGPNGRREGIRVLDVYPTLLTALGLPLPEDLTGHALVG